MASYAHQVCRHVATPESSFIQDSERKWCFASPRRKYVAGLHMRLSRCARIPTTRSAGPGTQGLNFGWKRQVCVSTARRNENLQGSCLQQKNRFPHWLCHLRAVRPWTSEYYVCTKKMLSWQIIFLKFQFTIYTISMDISYSRKKY